MREKKKQIVRIVCFSLAVLMLASVVVPIFTYFL